MFIISPPPKGTTKLWTLYSVIVEDSTTVYSKKWLESWHRSIYESLTDNGGIQKLDVYENYVVSRMER